MASGSARRRHDKILIIIVIILFFYPRYQWSRWIWKKLSIIIIIVVVSFVCSTVHVVCVAIFENLWSLTVGRSVAVSDELLVISWFTGWFRAMIKALCEMSNTCVVKLFAVTVTIICYYFAIVQQATYYTCVLRWVFCLLYMQCLKVAAGWLKNDAFGRFFQKNEWFL